MRPRKSAGKRLQGGPRRPPRTLEPARMKTYALDQGRETHTREAGCDDDRVDCGHHVNGWRTILDESTVKGERGAWWIRYRAGRAYREHREGDLTVFTFEAGQRCFREHRVPLDREPLYVVRGGDHRGNPRGEYRIHDEPEHWVEDFAEHTYRLNRARQ